MKKYCQIRRGGKIIFTKNWGLFTVNNQSPITNNQVVQTLAGSESTQQVVPITFTSIAPKVNDATTKLVTRNPTPVLTTPQQIPTVITKSAPRIVVEESPLRQDSAEQAKVTEITGEKIEEKPITTNSVEFSVDAAPPSPPIAANTIVGQVMDQDRKNCRRSYT